MITNHNQNITAGVANNSETNTTVILDGMASCNLWRERKKLILNVTVVVVRVWWRAIWRHHGGLHQIVALNPPI
jgi:hypothetical protein